VIVEKIAFYEVQQAPATRGVISLITSHSSLLYSTRMQLAVPIAVSAAVSIDTITCITVFHVSFFIV